MNNVNTIDSKMLMNSIEAQIIQLAKIVQVENTYTVEESIEYVRLLLARKHRELISEEKFDKIVSLKQSINTKITEKRVTEEEREIIKIFRYLGL